MLEYEDPGFQGPARKGTIRWRVDLWLDRHIFGYRSEPGTGKILHSPYTKAQYRRDVAEHKAERIRLKALFKRIRRG